MSVYSEREPHPKVLFLASSLNAIVQCSIFHFPSFFKQKRPPEEKKKNVLQY